MIDIKAIRAAAENGLKALHDVSTQEPSKWVVSMHPATVLAMCDEIEKLRKENEELLEIFKVKHHAALRFFEKEYALEKEIESLRKDAARYRWLRDGNDGTDNQAMLIAMDCYRDEWDEAIDAAMESK